MSGRISRPVFRERTGCGALERALGGRYVSAKLVSFDVPYAEIEPNPATGPDGRRGRGRALRRRAPGADEERR